MSSEKDERKKLKVNDTRNVETIGSLNEKYLLKIETSPSIDDFNRNYVQLKTPVIIDCQMSHWPAMQKWK
jgi:hypothetical protein